MEVGGMGKTECPGLKGETGATCPAPPGGAGPDWLGLLSGRGLPAELELLELALART